MEYIKIDKNLPIPLHLQLARSIRIAIQDGLLQTNAKLPTEDELGQKYDLSRPVVRQAYKQLLEERLIYRLKAKGTFVLPKEEHFNLLKLLFPLTEKISYNEVSENIEEIQREFKSYDSKTMPNLGLNKEDTVYCTKRLYYGERRTMFYIEIFQPEKYYPKSLENKDNSQIHRTIHVVKLENEICKLFNTPENTAGFKITSTTTNQENIITELNIAYVQGYNVSIILDYFKQ
ncbi:MAG: GntR family transcriptional regulator [Erysipelotrichaceae bacterium]|nr:GntR family transcriptional regulator [Erysipelotrichaceae bacterium]